MGIISKLIELSCSENNRLQYVAGGCFQFWQLVLKRQLKMLIIFEQFKQKNH